MEFGRSLAGVLAGALTLGAVLPAWGVGPVFIPNHSFELPVIPNAEPYASPFLVDWQKDNSEALFTSTGLFLNVDTPADPDSDPDINNLDGVQSAFLFGNPGAEIYQDLVATYQVGESYHLTIAIDGGGFGMPIGEAVLLRLYYRDALNNRVTIPSVGELTILNTHPLTNPLTPITHLTDQTLHLPTVQAGDAWAGKAIGIQIIAPQGAQGGYWDFDNVRLVPEPAMMGLAAFAGVCLARRRRI